jgi:hypothetical protein
VIGQGYPTLVLRFDFCEQAAVNLDEFRDLPLLFFQLLN